MTELTTIQEVRKAAVNGTRALKALLKSMEELDQGKILTSEFERARDVIECSKCFRTNVSVSLESGKCESCIREEEKEKRAEAARKQMMENWKGLVDDLNAEAGSGMYALDENINKQWPRSDFSIRREDGKYYCRIYRDDVYSRGSYRVSSHALKIDTNDYDVKANKMKKDFGAKNLAAGLHKKCDELMITMKTKVEKRIAKLNEEETIKEPICEGFGVGKQAIDNIYGKDYSRRGHDRLDYSRPIGYSFKFKNLFLKTYDGKEFNVGSIGKKLTIPKIKKLAEFIESL